MNTTAVVVAAAAAINSSEAEARFSWRENHQLVFGSKE